MIPVDVVPRVSAGRLVIGIRIGQSWPQQNLCNNHIIIKGGAHFRSGHEEVVLRGHGQGSDATAVSAEVTQVLVVVQRVVPQCVIISLQRKFRVEIRMMSLGCPLLPEISDTEVYQVTALNLVSTMHRDRQAIMKNGRYRF